MTQRKMKGEATTIIVIILVVLLLGALGFIAWQNLASEESSNNNKEASSQQSETETTEAVLSLSDWGVEIPVAQSTNTLSVNRSTTEGSSDVFYDVYAVLEGCDGAIGRIARIGKSSEEIPQEYRGANSYGAITSLATTWGELVAEKDAGARGRFASLAQVDDYVYSFTAPQNVSCRQWVAGVDHEKEAATVGITLEAATAEFEKNLFPELREIKK